jgi:hypothetical protein
VAVGGLYRRGKIEPGSGGVCEEIEGGGPVRATPRGGGGGEGNGAWRGLAPATTRGRRGRAVVGRLPREQRSGAARVDCMSAWAGRGREGAGPGSREQCRF